MDKENNILKSISYLEFVNKITSIMNDILYSPQNGYIYKNSKDAVLYFEDAIKKFDSEALKVSKTFDCAQVEQVIKSKKYILISEMKNHYDKQVLIWADEVFDELVDNCLFELSLNKNDYCRLFEQIKNALNWISDVRSFSVQEKEALLSNLEVKFNNVLKNDDYDYLSHNFVSSSNKDDFCYLWNLVLVDSDNFIKMDFSKYETKLTIEDMKYFENIKFKLQNYKKTSVLDEFRLISTALELSSITQNSFKYDFIKQINSDFLTHLEQAKTLSEDVKVKLIKRRLELFLDTNMKINNYYKKLITS